MAPLLLPRPNLVVPRPVGDVPALGSLERPEWSLLLPEPPDPGGISGPWPKDTRRVWVGTDRSDELADVLATCRRLHLRTLISTLRVEKYAGRWTIEQIRRGLAGAPYEVSYSEPNLFMDGGSSVIWQCLIGNGAANSGLNYFNNSQAYIGVGDSSTAAAATQTGLQASSNKTWVGMAASYPSQTDGLTSAAQTIEFQSSFGSSSANYAWNEEAVFNLNSNPSGLTNGRMLNRLASGQGTKSSGATWVPTFSLTIS